MTSWFRKAISAISSVINPFKQEKTDVMATLREKERREKEEEELRQQRLLFERRLAEREEAARLAQQEREREYQERLRVERERRYQERLRQERQQELQNLAAERARLQQRQQYTAALEAQRQRQIKQRLERERLLKDRQVAERRLQILRKRAISLKAQKQEQIKQRKFKKQLNRNPVLRLAYDLSIKYDLQPSDRPQLVEDTQIFRIPDEGHNTLTQDDLDNIVVADDTEYTVKYVIGDQLSKEVVESKIYINRGGSNDIAYFIDPEDTAELYNLRAAQIKSLRQSHNILTVFYDDLIGKAKSAKRKAELGAQLKAELTALHTEFAIWIDIGEYVHPPQPLNEDDYLFTGVTGTWTGNLEHLRAGFNEAIEVNEDQLRYRTYIIKASLYSLKLSLASGRIIPVMLSLYDDNLGYFEDKPVGENNFVVYPPYEISDIPEDDIKSKRFYGYFPWELPTEINGIELKDLSLNIDTRNSCVVTSWSTNPQLSNKMKFEPSHEAKCYLALQMIRDCEVMISIESAHKMWEQMAIHYKTNIWCSEYRVVNGKISKAESRAYPDKSIKYGELERLRKEKRVKFIKIKVYRIDQHIFNCNDDNHEKYLQGLAIMHYKNELTMGKEYQLDDKMKRKQVDMTRSISVWLHMERLTKIDNDEIYKMLLDQSESIYISSRAHKIEEDDESEEEEEEKNYRTDTRVHYIYSHNMSQVSSIIESGIREAYIGFWSKYDKLADDYETPDDEQLKLGRSLVIVCKSDPYEDMRELYSNVQRSIHISDYYTVTAIITCPKSSGVTSIMIKYKPFDGYVDNTGRIISYTVRIDLVDQSLMPAEHEDAKSIGEFISTRLSSAAKLNIFNYRTISEYSSKLAFKEGVLTRENSVSGILNQIHQNAVFGGQQHLDKDRSVFEHPMLGDLIYHLGDQLPEKTVKRLASTTPTINAEYIEKHIEKVLEECMNCADINSLYPFQCTQQPMGCGEVKEIESYEHLLQLLDEQKQVMANISCEWADTERNKRPITPCMKRWKNDTTKTCVMMINSSFRKEDKTGIEIKWLLENRDVEIKFHRGFYYTKTTKIIMKYFRNILSLRADAKPPLDKLTFKKLANLTCGNMISRPRYVKIVHKRNDYNTNKSKLLNEMLKKRKGFGVKSAYTILKRCVIYGNGSKLCEVLHEFFKIELEKNGMNEPNLITRKVDKALKDWDDLNKGKVEIEDKRRYLQSVLEDSQRRMSSSAQFQFKHKDDLVKVEKYKHNDKFDAITCYKAKRPHTSHNHWGAQYLAGAKCYYTTLADAIGQENIIYGDTDSFFMTKEGYENLKKLELIGTEPGMLKIEYANIVYAKFTNHKMYYLILLDFDDEGAPYLREIKKCAGRPSASLDIDDYVKTLDISDIMDGDINLTVEGEPIIPDEDVSSEGSEEESEESDDDLSPEEAFHTAVADLRDAPQTSQLATKYDKDKKMSKFLDTIPESSWFDEGSEKDDAESVSSDVMPGSMGDVFSYMNLPVVVETGVTNGIKWKIMGKV